MDYLILALATWRLSNLLVNEDGPWELLTRLRSLAGVRYNNETFQPYVTNPVAGAFLCIWCMSVWVAVVWTIFYQASPHWAIYAALPFALSAGAVLMDGWVNRA